MLILLRCKTWLLWLLLCAASGPGSQVGADLQTHKEDNPNGKEALASGGLQPGRSEEGNQDAQARLEEMKAALESMESAPSESDVDGPKRAGREMYLRMEAGFALLDLKRGSEARPYFRDALALARMLDEDGMIITNLSALLEIAFEVGHFRRALNYTNDALVLAKSMGRTDLQIKLLGNLASIEIRLEDSEAAVATIGEAMKLMNPGQSPLDEARLRVNLSVAYMELGRYEESEDVLNQALLTVLDQGSLIEIAAVLANLGDVYCLSGDYERARGFMEDALQIREEEANEGAISDSYRSLGLLEHGLGNDKKAFDYLGRAQEIQERLQLPAQLITTLHVTEQVYSDLDHYSEASSEGLQGLALAEAMRLRDRHVLVLDELAKLQLEHASPRKALRATKRARQLRETAYTVDLARTMSAAQLEQENQRNKHELDLLRRDKSMRDQERRYLLLAGSFCLIVAVVGWGFFLRKKKTLRRLDQAHQDLGRANLEILERASLLEDAMKKIQQLQEERIRADRIESIGVLAGGIAHDFNNVLAVVLTNVSMAKSVDCDPAERQRMLMDAGVAVRQGQRLSSQLLAFAKGGEPLSKLQSMASLLRSSTGFVSSGSNALLHYDIANDLWPARVDEGQISQLLGNLVINSIQAMPNGGTIRISARNISPEARMDSTSAKIQVSISDDGPGIPEELIARVFDPYYTTKADGSGLGLTIAHAIVMRHGGAMRLLACKRGTKVEFELPAVPGGVLTRSSNEEEILRGQGRILVMDDEPMILRLFQRALSQIGYEPTLAHDGEQAITEYTRALATKNQFRAVILDLTLPGGRGGVEVLGELQALDPEVVAVVASGYADTGALANYRTIGFAGMLSKPFGLTRLSQVLAEVLGAHAETQATGKS